MRRARHIILASALVAGMVLLAGCGSTKTVTVIHTVTRSLTTTSIATTTVQAPQPVYVPSQDGKPEYKPSAIYLSVDSGNIWMIKRWISYGGEFAEAIATTDANDCVPDCAGGHHTTAVTTIQFKTRIACDGVPAYGSFEVMKSSNQTVAPEGSEQDLELFC